MILLSVVFIAVVCIYGVFDWTPRRRVGESALAAPDPAILAELDREFPAALALPEWWSQDLKRACPKCALGPYLCIDCGGF